MLFYTTESVLLENSNDGKKNKGILAAIRKILDWISSKIRPFIKALRLKISNGIARVKGIFNKNKRLGANSGMKYDKGANSDISGRYTGDKSDMRYKQGASSDASSMYTGNKSDMKYKQGTSSDTSSMYTGNKSDMRYKQGASSGNKNFQTRGANSQVQKAKNGAKNNNGTGGTRAHIRNLSPELKSIRAKSGNSVKWLSALGNYLAKVEKELDKNEQTLKRLSSIVESGKAKEKAVRNFKQAQTNIGNINREIAAINREQSMAMSQIKQK